MPPSDITPLPVPLHADTEIEAQMASAARTWQIHLKSGNVIEFTAGWNSPHPYGPAVFMQHVKRYLFDGTLPNETAPFDYRFPDPNNEARAVAIVAVRVEDVVAVTQLF